MWACYAPLLYVHLSVYLHTCKTYVQHIWSFLSIRFLGGTVMAKASAVLFICSFNGPHFSALCILHFCWCLSEVSSKLQNGNRASLVRAACHLIFRAEHRCCAEWAFWLGGECSSGTTQGSPNSCHESWEHKYTLTMQLFTVCSFPFWKAVEPVKLLYVNSLL